MNQTNPEQTSTPTGKHLWLLGVMGVIQLILGFIALSLPVATGAASMLMLGILFIAGAFVSLYQCIAVKGFRIWHLVAAILYALVGAYILQNLGLALVSVTFLIGWLFVGGGILRLVTSFKMRASPGNAWRILNGIVTLLLGGMVIFQWPESSAWLLGTLIAIELLFTGWATLFLSLSAKKAIS